MTIGAPVQGPAGLEALINSSRMTARGRGFAQGEVGVLDLAQSDGFVNNNTIGNEFSGFANVVAATTSAGGQIAGVWQDDVELNHTGTFNIQGELMAIVTKATGGNVSPGDPLVLCVASATLTADLVAGDRYLAINLDLVTAPGDEGILSRVLFAGATGLGTQTA